MSYSLVCGIEIHVELKTKSKMFCGCKNDPFHAPKPNMYTCPVCLGMPGALPVANKKAIEWTIQIGQALGCEIALFSKFDRKHYFYPDLPKGYQISQYDQPLCVNGLLKTELGDVRITRVHLEEDTGKLHHETVNGEKVSLIDFNRSGVPLVEIVTEPDIKSPEHAKAYAKKIAQIIRHLGVSSADMEKGSMRLEANISLQGQETRGKGTLPNYKVEVKNLNSFRYIERAIVYEMKRQAEILDQGKTPVQETRGWNEVKNQTFAQRSKESAEDYRYFPDPDLPPLRFSKDYIENLKQNLPKLPDQVIQEWVSWGMKPTEAEILSQDLRMGPILAELKQEAEKRGLSFSGVITQVVNKKVNFSLPSRDESVIIGPIVEDILTQSIALSKTQDVDDDTLKKVILEVIQENPKAVADYKSGKQQVLGFLMGMVKKKLRSVDTKIISTSLQQYLS